MYILSSQQVVSKVSMLNLVPRAVSEGKEPWERVCYRAASVGKLKKLVEKECLCGSDRGLTLALDLRFLLC